MRYKIMMTVIYIVLIFSMFLTACQPIRSLDAEVELTLQDHWDVKINITFASNLALLGVTPEQIEQQIYKLLAGNNNAQQDVSITTDSKQDRNGNYVFYIRLSGMGLDLLNQTIFNGSAMISRTEHEGKPAIQININPLAAQFAQLGAQQVSITIKGGKILSSNGIEKSYNRVSWINPQSNMYVVMREPNLINDIPLPIIVGFILIVAAVTIIYSKSKTKTSHKSLYKNMKTTKTCPKCHKSIPIAARYCPFCRRHM